METLVENCVPLSLMSKGERMKMMEGIGKKEIRGENAGIDNEYIFTIRQGEFGACQGEFGPLLSMTIKV